MEREDEERRLRREMRRIKRKKEERIRQLILAGFFTAASVIILAAVIVLFKNVFQKKQVDPGEVQVPEYHNYPFSRWNVYPVIRLCNQPDHLNNSSLNPLLLPKIFF